MQLVNGLRLFKPYFEQYQKWRDNAINKAQNFIEEGTDILMISVDVKQYFYNINLTNKLSNFKKDLKKKSSNKSLPLTSMLLKIHEVYQLKLKDNIPNNIDYKNCIPIGLLSSGIIGNWFLKDLDLKIIDNLSPVYYGRYVDDIIIVLSNASVNENEKKPKSAILKKFFIDRNILINKEETPNVYSYSDDENIILQKDKTTVYAFDSKESHAVLEKFKKNIEKNSSAFWFLPDEENADEDFDDNVYELTYSDTSNKLRSISEIKQSKYGASIYLAKKIKLALLSDDKKDLKTTKQILTFFKGRINLEFNSIWEKALTYFIIQNNTKAFYRVY
ncbi:reverse transcriptase domain-containing protein [Ochrovirga pacifica]|uniref:reverse transcriptase domain-containing protein n=1 Tax=Ochrovirga pacifica TaxID=1042376 RepID=UPI0002D83E6A|nr:reverse transcriptase domain-containing protein [Ochrovirga pacifica]